MALFSITIIFAIGYYSKPFTEEKYKLRKKRYIIQIWIIFYLISIAVEFLGYIIGLWEWYEPENIFLHAGYWWATVMTLSGIYLSNLSKATRYFAVLLPVLIYQFIQEACIHIVTHYSLFGSKYLMIFVVMILVCLTTLHQPELLCKVGLLERKT